jgi:hypothetical protein
MSKNTLKKIFHFSFIKVQRNEKLVNANLLTIQRLKTMMIIFQRKKLSFVVVVVVVLVIVLWNSQFKHVGVNERSKISN